MSGDSDDDFVGGDANADNCYPSPVGDIKKGGYIVYKGRPAKVIETLSSKTGKHGHEKMRITAIDIFNENKYETIQPSSHKISVPEVDRSEYQLIDLTDDGFCSLMLSNGSIREDLRLPDGDIGDAIRKQYENEKILLLSSTKAMGLEQIMSFRQMQD
ncbi:MAG: putative eukaryotic translation initiation factor 5A [Streblomastix strix]|uniref:Eukaryotic translation initiation factor 5A n=1 Tax=Streblomastix strix TaxID=222440 RepID=A0A5J4WPW0_9EUKA|nr:MAG: putative eukaryotic translation initiation factor 5A [Streblomastix strix]